MVFTSSEWGGSSREEIRNQIEIAIRNDYINETEGGALKVAGKDHKLLQKGCWLFWLIKFAFRTAIVIAISIIIKKVVGL